MNANLSPSPVVMVDDNEADLYLLETCKEQSTLTHPWLGFSGPTKFLDHLSEVSGGRQPMPVFTLLDINMPVMNGFELFDRIRHDPYFVDLPVFMMLTSSNDASDREQARIRGIHTFLRKTASLDEYVAFFDALDVPGLVRRPR